MLRQYLDDRSEPSRRHVTIQPSDSSSRRSNPSTSRDFAFQSTFQPNRERNVPTVSRPHHHYTGEQSHSDRHSNSSRSTFKNSSDNRQYRLEAPSIRSHSQWSNNNHDDLSRSSDRRHSKSKQSSSNNLPPSQSSRLNQDHQRNNRRHRPEQISPSQSNHRSLDVASTHQHSNPIRSFNPTHRSSLLGDIIQSFFGEHNSSRDDRSSPTDLIGFALIMQRPGAIRIQFGDLFDILGHDQTPSVGLSEVDIQRIPTMNYRNSSKSKSSDEKCSICLSKYKTGETIKRLRCKHFFHPECIDPWLKTSTQCPICRAAQTE